MKVGGVWLLRSASPLGRAALLSELAFDVEPQPPPAQQMSVCQGNITISWGHLFQQPGIALRYTTL